jgi:hypothetical protein
MHIQICISLKHPLHVSNFCGNLYSSSVHNTIASLQAFDLSDFEQMKHHVNRNKDWQIPNKLMYPVLCDVPSIMWHLTVSYVLFLLAQVSLSNRPSVCLSVNFKFTFSTSSSEPLDQLKPYLEQITRGWGIQVCSNEGERLSPRGDNSKGLKYTNLKKKIFSRTTRPNSIKLGTNYL